jgi:RNA polymerase sigma-70 factor, ECF subfamily
MQRVASYDSKALEGLYNRYSPIMYSLIKKIIPNAQSAEDTLADVFEIVWRKIQFFNIDSGNIYTWLILLTRNKAVDNLRKMKNHKNISEYSEEYENENILPNLSKEAEPMDLAMALGIKEGVFEAMNKLTDAQQYVITMAFYGGLTENEIASKLNIPPQTVKSKIKISLTNLRDNLIRGVDSD